MASTWASKASNELHNLQGLEQELDLQLEEARELKQSLQLNLEYDTALLSEMTSEADAPSHGLARCRARCLEKLPQKQGKTAVSNSSRSPVRKEAQSDITEKRERDCDNNAAGKQVTSMQKEETDDTKRQKKLGGGSSSKSSSSSSSNHKPTATVTRPQPTNQTSAETAGVSALDGTIEKE